MNVEETIATIHRMAEEGKSAKAIAAELDLDRWLVADMRNNYFHNKTRKAYVARKAGK